MKKTKLFMLFIATLLLTGCGANKNITVTDNLGTTTEMKISELINASENDAKFNKYYYGAQVTFEGKIKSIVVDGMHNIMYQPSRGAVSDSIIFETVDGITIELGLDNGVEDLSSLNIGDTLKVNSYIMNANSSFLYVGTYLCENSKCKWESNEKITSFELIK